MSTSKSLVELMRQRDEADRQRAELQAQIDSHKQAMSKLLTAVKKACETQKVNPIDVAIALFEEAGAPVPYPGATAPASKTAPTDASSSAPKRRGRPPKSEAAQEAASKTSAPTQLKEVLPPAEVLAPSVEQPQQPAPKKAVKKVAKKVAKKAGKKVVAKKATSAKSDAKTSDKKSVSKASSEVGTKMEVGPPVIDEPSLNEETGSTPPGEPKKRQTLTLKKNDSEKTASSSPVVEELPPTDPEGSPFQSQQPRTPLEYSL